jgi:predicted anti-sigma-YlaC factor YlaD
MTRCDDLRLLMTLDDERNDAQVVAHLECCDECRGFVLTLDAWQKDARTVGDALEPTGDLEARISASPCQRWLSLLFLAVDRDISSTQLERLLQHLDQCDSCRDAWNDLSLMHQVGQALRPGTEAIDRCLAIPRLPRRPRVLGRRTVAAAAYAVAVTASLVIGNPVLIARTPPRGTVQRVATDVRSEMAEVAENGRGELRVVLWRIWQAAERGAASIRETFDWLAERGPTSSDNDNRNHNDNDN